MPIHLASPTLDDPISVKEFIERLEALPPETRGIKTLTKHVKLAVRSLDILESHKQAIERSLRYCAGERQTSSATAERRLEAQAHKFYDHLSTAALRQHCTAFKLNFDSYDTIDDVIQALVEGYVQQSSL